MARRFLTPLVMRIAELVDVDRMIRSLDDRIRQIVNVPILDGQLFQDIDATDPGVEVVHGLGRTPKGAIVVRASAFAGYIIDEFNSTSFTITASEDSTVTLWVF